MKTLTSVLAVGATLAFAAHAGIAANTKHSTTRVGYGPYAYLGNTAQAKQSTIKVGLGPYAFLGNTAPVVGNSPYAFLGNTASAR